MAALSGNGTAPDTTMHLEKTRPEKNNARTAFALLPRIPCGIFPCQSCRPDVFCRFVCCCSFSFPFLSGAGWKRPRSPVEASCRRRCKDSNFAFKNKACPSRNPGGVPDGADRGASPFRKCLRDSCKQVLGLGANRSGKSRETVLAGSWVRLSFDLHPAWLG